MKHIESLLLGEENVQREKITYKTNNYVDDYDSSVDVSVVSEVVAAVLRSIYPNSSYFIYLYLV